MFARSTHETLRQSIPAHHMSCTHAVMLTSAVLAIAILALASLTAGDLAVDHNSTYSGKTSTCYLNPSELFRALQGQGLPIQFTQPAAMMN